MAVSKNRSYLFFFLAILTVSILMFAVQWNKRRTPSLIVPQNRGISELFTLDSRLAAVFQDGRTCVWDWSVLEIKQADFTVGSGRVIPLAGARLAAAGRLGDRRVLSVYDLDTARKIKDLTVGWEDQDVYLRVSHDRNLTTVIRRTPESTNQMKYEFLIVDIGAEILRPAVLRTLDADSQVLRDFAVSDAGILVAVGADGGKARLLAMDLNTGQNLWDKTWPDAEELTTVAIAFDGQTVWTGDRGGNLLAASADDGSLQHKLSLLRPGETRQVTNDFSVLNLVFSPDGRWLGCTVAPVAYAVDAESGRIQRFEGHKVVSKVAFSPDSRKLATSDLRADGAIRIRTLD